MMLLQYEHNQQPITLSVEPDGTGWQVHLPDGSEHRIEVDHSEDGIVTVRTGARTFRAATARVGSSVHISYYGRTYDFEPPTTKRPGSAAHASGALEAPMPGVVADVLVQTGEEVEAYQPLAVVEAMKVMATIEAPFKGVVAGVLVKKGQRVAQGELLVQIESIGEEDAKHPS
jgi:biotin carboxyl carrier protein